MGGQEPGGDGVPLAKGTEVAPRGAPADSEPREGVWYVGNPRRQEGVDIRRGQRPQHCLGGGAGGSMPRGRSWPSPMPARCWKSASGPWPRVSARPSACRATSPGTTRSRRSSRRSAAGGAASTSWCTPSPSPGRKTCPSPTCRTGREGFHTALDISSYSLVALTRHAAELMKGRGGAVVTLTYMGVREGGAQLQCHGRGQGRPGSQRPLPGPRSRSGGDTGQRHLRRPGEDPGRRRHRRVPRHAAPCQRAGAAQAQCRPGRDRQDRRLSGERPGKRGSPEKRSTSMPATT